VNFTKLTATAFALACLTACGGGGSSSSAPVTATAEPQTTNTPPPQPAPAPVAVAAASTEISGKVTFDRVPHTAASGLDYNNSFEAPIRGATIEAINTSGDIIASTRSNAQGQYSLSVQVEF